MARSGLGYLTVGSFLTTAAGRYGAHEAVYCTATGRRFSYAQFNARCNRLANALLGLGLKKGDCVAFLSTNRAEVGEIYFATASTSFISASISTGASR
jgi:fatty-acyl-CoA synthase